MTRIGLDRRGKSLPCGFGLSRNVLWTLNKIWEQWLESFCIFIRQQAVLNCEKIISQLGKNIFPVGAIWFCSWGLVFRQLLHEYTAWICVVSLRQVSESQNVRLCLLKTSCFPSPVRPHTRCPRSRVYNIMRVGQESLLFFTLTVK